MKGKWRFITLLFCLTILMTACEWGEKQKDHSDQTVETFFTDLWLNRDYEKAKAMTAKSLSTKELSKEAKKVSDQKWKRIRKVYLMYREMPGGDSDQREYLLYAIDYERRIRLRMERSSEGWKVTGIDSQQVKDMDTEEMNRHKWKGRELQGEVD
ncbi:hypothetical protein [Salinithrix halophila]|uniref:DUF4878 domain-containing protein n=1 Tax=Salinithrix halophila TaxID=1485204 RepID=A0ABV8JGF2_9BACL